MTVSKSLAAACLSLLLSVSAAAGTLVENKTQWNGFVRYYSVYVPTALPANAPMVLFLHPTQNGGPTSPPWTSNPNLWEPLAEKNKFLLVYPVSTYNPRSDQWYWECNFFDFSFPVSPDDSGYLRNLVTTLTAQYHINPKEVFVSGMSSGGYMAHRVGTDSSDLVAAIAPVSGPIWVQPDGQTQSPLPPAQPISVIEFHGTLDNDVPYCGGTGREAWKELGNTVASTQQSIDYWVSSNACLKRSTTQTTCTASNLPNPHFTGLTASSCNGNVEVQFVPEAGVGHVWVRGTETTIWQFFSTHGR